MPKLLIVTTVPSTIKAFLLPHADYFKAKGWQVDALTGEGKTKEEITCHFDNVWTVRWTRNPLNLKNMLRTPQKIKRLVENEGHDLVHVHTPIAAFVTRFALKGTRAKTNTKVIYTAHGFHFHKEGHFFTNCLFFFLEKIAARWTDFLILINEEDYKKSIDSKLMPTERLALINGVGIDLHYYSAEAVSPNEVNSVRERLGMSQEHKLLLMIAEFNPGKRHKDAVKALAGADRKDIHLAFAGEGKKRTDIEKLAEKLNVAERVHFLGRVKDVRPYILASEATLLPSEREGLPRSVMESLALGVPVIGANARGTRDLLSCSQEMLYPVGDISALASIIDTFDKGQQQTSNIEMDAYDLDTILMEVENIYSRIITRKQGANVSEK